MVVAKVDPETLISKTDDAKSTTSKQQLIEPNTTTETVQDNPIHTAPVVQKTNRKPCIKLTKRERKGCTIYPPLMLLLLLINIGIILIFEIACDKTIDVLSKIDLIFTSVQWTRWSNYLSAACSFGALIGVIFILPYKTMLKYAIPLTCAAMILTLFFSAIFPVIHYHIEADKISPNVGVLKTKTARKDEFFHKRVFSWLDRAQAKLGCCGLEDYDQYNSTHDNSSVINDGDWIHLESFVSNATDVPDSCCKKIKKDCGKDAFKDQSNIHKVGCRIVIDATLSDCEPFMWMLGLLPLVIGVPTYVLAYMFTRHCQGLNHFGACCSNPLVIEDPEGVEEPKETDVPTEPEKISEEPKTPEKDD